MINISYVSALKLMDFERGIAIGWPSLPLEGQVCLLSGSISIIEIDRSHGRPVAYPGRLRPSEKAYASSSYCLGPAQSESSPECLESWWTRALSGLTLVWVCPGIFSVAATACGLRTGLLE
jgi:hypothetical protein